jgi:hypothetical protein
MLIEAAGINKKDRVITNKTMGQIKISRMEEVEALVEKGMCNISHWDAKPYAKYRTNATRQMIRFAKVLYMAPLLLQLERLFNSRICYCRRKRCINIRRYVQLRYFTWYI